MRKERLFLMKFSILRVLLITSLVAIVLSLAVIVMIQTDYAKNFVGYQKGYSGCMCCGDTWDWKDGHSTSYSLYSPEEQKQIEKIEGEGFFVAIVGYGCFPLCEECWQPMTPEERLPYYMQLVDDWIRENPEDKEHYEQRRAAIKIAVLNET
jgi:hypothetical protein